MQKTEYLERDTFTEGEEVVCENEKPLPGNDKVPPLELDKKYPVLKIYTDDAGNQHLDVGLTSTLGWISNYETGEKLPEEYNNGRKIHWCHPSRFKLAP